VRLVGVAVSNLVEEGEPFQLDLAWPEEGAPPE
jgi:hypothetical protein